MSALSLIELARLARVTEADCGRGLMVELATGLAAQSWTPAQCRSFVDALTPAALAFVFHFFAEHGGPHYATLRAAIDYVTTREELARTVEECRSRWECAAQPDDRWHVPAPPRAATTTTPARVAAALRHWMADPRPDLPETPSRLSLLQSTLLEARGFSQEQIAELRDTLDESERALLCICLDGLDHDSRMTLRPLHDAIASGMSRDEIGGHYRSFIDPWVCGGVGPDGRPLAVT